MSRGPQKVVGKQEGGDYAAAFRALNRMIDDGRSFSGYERNRCFLNTGQLRFADVSAVSGLDFLDDARTMVSVDWDGDGDLDLFQVNRTAPQLRFLRNDWSNGHHWLSLRLVGTQCNRDAIGARVRLYRKGVTQHDIRSVRAGNAFLSQSSKWVHFGLANNRDIERVVVHWPGGQAETFVGLEADRRYRLVQGSGQPESVPAMPATSPLASSIPQLPPEPEQARVLMSARLPLPEFEFQTFDGQPQKLSWGQPTLIQLWASWCPKCRAEMEEFTARADELRQAKLRILALCVDGIGSDETDVAAAGQAIAERGFPFPAARATAPLLRELEILRAELFSNSRPFPVPTCFLVDPDGRLAAIYVGPIKVDQLLADLAEMTASPRRQRQIGLPFEGRWLTPPKSVRLTAIARAMREEGFADKADWYQERAAPQKALSHCGLAIDAEKKGGVDTARTHYVQALKLAPQSAEIQNYVGEFFARQRDVASALKRFRAATSLARELEDENEKVAKYHYNLARILAVMKRSAEAQSSFRMAIQFDPRHGLAHTGLAKLLQDDNRWTESIRYLEEALASNSDLAPAHVYWGVALVRQKQLAKAAGHFEKALRVDPRLADAQAHLANVLAAQGKLAAAVPLYRKLLRANPKLNGIALKLAWCLATCREQEMRSGTEAVQLAQRVVDATQVKAPAVLDVLAAAHAETGEFEKALAIIADAEELAKDRPQWIRLLKQRRNLYENRQPVRAGLPST